MIKNQRLLFIISLAMFLIISSVSVFASISLPNGFVYYEFENNRDDSWNGGSNSLTGGTLTTSGKVGAYSINTTSVVQNTTFLSDSSESITNISTISCWMNLKGVGSDIVNFAISDGASSSDSLMWWHDGSTNFIVRSYIDTVSKWSINTGNSLVYEDWYLITLVRETSSGKIQLYFNDTIKGNATSTSFLDTGYDQLSLGGGIGGIGTSIASFDNCVFDKDEWNSADVTAAFNSGAGDTFSLLPEAGNLTVTLLSPANGSINNTELIDFYYNVSSEDANLYQCSLFTNKTGVWNTALTNTSPTNASTNLFQLNFSDGTYNWNVFCNDTNGTSDFGNINYTLFIDTVQPAMITNFINNSAFFSLGSNITAWFNISDDTLVNSLNISIDGTTFYVNESIGLSSFNYFFNFDPSSIGAGTHTLYTRRADGHTAKKLKDPKAWNPTNGLFNDKIEYKFKAPYNKMNLKIELKDGSIFDDWQTIQKYDRFSEIVVPKNPKSSMTFVVESNKKIYVVEDPTGQNKYGGKWLITGEHWKDFVVKNEPNAILSFNQINDYKVEVTISGLKNPERIEFESTGDLNIVEQSFIFHTINASISYESSVVDSQSTNFLINFSEGTDVTDISATLIYNGTSYATTESSGTGYQSFIKTLNIPLISSYFENRSFYWQYTFTGANTIIDNTSLFNQTIIGFILDNCTATTTPSLNFSLIDETTLEPVDGTITANINYHTYSSLLTKSAGFGFSGKNNYTICMQPNTTSITASSNGFVYTASGYEIKNYEFSGITLTNESQNINLYLLNSSLSTEVLIEVKNELDDVVEGATIRVRRFFPETGTYITTEILETDYTGKTQAHLVLDDIFYSFIIEKDGDVVLEVSPARIYSTSLLFIINEASALDFYDKVWYSTSPDNSILTTNTNVTMGFTTISPSNYISWYAIISHFNGTAYVNNDTTSDGGTIEITLNLENFTGNIINEYLIQLSDEALYNFSRTFNVVNFTPSNHSLIELQDALEDQIPLFWRVIIAVGISLIAMVIFAWIIPPDYLGIVGYLVQLFFALPPLRWIPLTMIIIESIVVLGFYFLHGKGEQ